MANVDITTWNKTAASALPARWHYTYTYAGTHFPGGPFSTREVALDVATREFSEMVAVERSRKTERVEV